MYALCNGYTRDDKNVIIIFILLFFATVKTYIVVLHVSIIFSFKLYRDVLSTSARVISRPSPVSPPIGLESTANDVPNY